MNHFLKIIIFLSATVALFSCNDEFVNEKLTISGVATSNIIISPEWEADDYQFKCEGVKEADFTITGKPEWLVVDSNTGKITDSIATIHGAVKAEPRFSNIGFYIDQMIVTISNKQYAVPVYYITEGNPSAQVDRQMNINATDYSSNLQISNSGEGILLWDIVSLPPWLTVNESQMNPQLFILGKGSTAQLPFTFNFQAAMQNNLKGTIVLKTNDKNNPVVEIAVTANLGTPNLYLNTRELTWGTTETTKTITFYNEGNGILVWSIEGLPDWLSVSTTGGSVRQYYTSSDITFTCNRSNLQPGLNTATVTLKTNDADEPSVAIKVSVRVPGTGLNIRAVEGNIKDAAFDKNTNTLYYVTGQPNKLVAYDVTNKTVLHEVALTNAPTCLGIDENFKKALIGHGGAISAVDLSSFQVSKSFTISSTVFDVEWASADWFCYTYDNTYNSYLMWINASTGETYQTPQDPLNYVLGTANLQKIPNQPYIIASRTNVSPTGIFVFNTDTKKLKSYTHSSIGNSWFIKQGELMVTGISSVFRTSAITEVTGNQINNPSAIGQLKVGQYANMSWWTDYSEAKHSIWALLSYYTNSLYPPEKGTIYQFEDNDFTFVKSYAYDYLYQPNAQTPAYEVEARYLFANSQGTELTVLRKGTSNNTWSLEFISVQ